MKFCLTHLYPHHMELYGDMGNIRAIIWTLNQLGIDVAYQPIEPGEPLPNTSHLYFIGGGQDQQQLEISADLIEKGTRIIEDVARGVPLLAICGGYQLLGREFVTGEGVSIPGVGLFPVVTRALDTSIHSRSIGDVVLDCMIPDLKGVKIVGFENHSGQTFLNSNRTVDNTPKVNHVLPEAYYLGKVLVGKGNNSEEGYEGCVVNNAIGTYLHGSCLPKNPELTHFLIRAGLAVGGFGSITREVDQSIALKAKAQRLRILL